MLSQREMTRGIQDNSGVCSQDLNRINHALDSGTPSAIELNVEAGKTLLFQSRFAANFAKENSISLLRKHGAQLLMPRSIYLDLKKDLGREDVQAIRRSNSADFAAVSNLVSLYDHILLENADTPNMVGHMEAFLPFVAPIMRLTAKPINREVARDRVDSLLRQKAVEIPHVDVKTGKRRSGVIRPMSADIMTPKATPKHGMRGFFAFLLQQYQSLAKETISSLTRFLPRMLRVILLFSVQNPRNRVQLILQLLQKIVDHRQMLIKEMKTFIAPIFQLKRELKR